MARVAKKTAKQIAASRRNVKKAQIASAKKRKGRGKKVAIVAGIAAGGLGAYAVGRSQYKKGNLLIQGGRHKGRKGFSTKSSGGYRTGVARTGKYYGAVGIKIKKRNNAVPSVNSLIAGYKTNRSYGSSRKTALTNQYYRVRGI